ncbi:MAG: glycosyltransferase family 4 protein [Syntrophotalea acetylenica]|nr:glycosyltransferase family 4 protein [Syntrophotalea acetylenica]
MHILYLHQYFVPPDGASGTRSYEMARRLVQSGHKVTLVTGSSGFPPGYHVGEGLKQLVIDGISLKVLPVPYSNRFSFYRRLRAFFEYSLRSLVQICREERVDLVFATSTPLTIAIPGWIAKLWHRCPMVFEVRDLWPEMPIAIGALRNPVLIWLAEKLEQFAYRHAAHVIALSPGIARGVALAGYPENKITVIPNSCDVSLFRFDSQQGNPFLEQNPMFREKRLVVYAGTFGFLNGVDYLAEIAREMALLDSEICFLVVGHGREEEKVAEKAASLGVLNKNFWMLPPVPKNFMPYVLGAAALGVSTFIDLPQMWNNSANKFFDCLAAGRPVVINYAGWQAEFLARTGAGLVVPPRQPDEAARRIHAFLQDPDRLCKARAAARAAADQEFNRDRLAAQLEGIFRSLV